MDGYVISPIVGAYEPSALVSTTILSALQC